MISFSRTINELLVSHKCSLFALIISLFVLVDEALTAWHTDGLCLEYYNETKLATKLNSDCSEKVTQLNLFCCDGYIELSRINRNGGVEVNCLASCKNKCVRGVCVKPDTCACLENHYQLSQYVCAPVCNPYCKNANCVDVDTCSCYHGYKMKDGSTSECEPICEQQCDNGFCASPGVCKCYEGYKMENGSCKPNCTEGYKFSPDRNECIPQCESPCINGICVRANICRCLDGFRTTINDSNVCEPVCEPSCINGNCVVPGICHCDNGYIKLKDNICVPVCLEGCVNGNCVRPGSCECYEGYHRKNDHLCEPSCTIPCINSICVAPDTCQCHLGYMQDSNFSCSPVCQDGCSPGTCISPDQCECPKGYIANRGEKCEPLCSNSCTNGFCVEPEICACSDGYLWDSYSESCVHICLKPCLNGICTSLNTCECIEGYTNKSETECVPECIPNCLNGFCSSPDSCTCFSGYNKHPEDPSICLPELGELSHSNSTMFLNNYHYPSVLRYNNEIDTYIFTSLPTLKVRKDCPSLFQDTLLNETALNSKEMQILCQPHHNSTKLHVILYCQWSLEYIFNSSRTNFIQNEEPQQNITLTPADLSLLILFSEEYRTEEINGSCDISISLLNKSRYLSMDNEISLLVVASPNVLSLRMVDWRMLVGVGCVILSMVSLSLIMVFASFILMRGCKS